MSPRWSPSERLRVAQELSQLRGADSQAFFDAHGLGSAYRAPGEGNSRKAWVTSALYAAEQRGDLDAILDGAAAYLRQNGTGSTSAPQSAIAGNLPRPATVPQGALLQTVWDSFVRDSRWPTFREIDRTYDRRYREDILDVARELPTGLISPDLRSSLPDPEIKLTIAGAVACDGSAELVRLFLEAVKVATQLEADLPSGLDAPMLTPDSLSIAAGIRLPASEREDTLLRLGHLLGAENWGWSGSGWEDPAKPTWNFRIGREVRRFRNVDSIEEYWNIAHPPPAPAAQNPIVVSDYYRAAAVSDPEPQRIFLVHGHDEARHEVARFLEKSTPAAEVIVLSEQAGRGRTIIEMFVDLGSTASFAVVLLTPDDLGRSKDATELRPRARQNVVLELGYFLAELERDRIAVLNKGVEKPSDIDGLRYIDYPGSSWKLELARELKAAGFECDPTKG